MSPEIHSSAPEIGSPEDKMLWERVVITDMAFNALMKAQKIQQQISDSENPGCDSIRLIPMPYGPITVPSPTRILRPIVNRRRRAQAIHFQALGEALLPDDPRY